MQLIHQYITLQLVQIIPFTNIIATLPNFPMYTIARVHNISIEGERLTVYIATLYKCTVSSNKNAKRLFAASDNRFKRDKTHLMLKHKALEVHSSIVQQQ